MWLVRPTPRVVRLEVLHRAVRVERGAHRGEDVAAPPDAGVIGQRDRDAVLAQLPGRRVALAGVALGLGRDRGVAAGGGDLVVAVRGQGGRVHVDRARGHVAAVVHLVDADVAGHVADARVRGDRDAEVPGDVEGGLLREAFDAGQVEGDLEAEHVALAVEPAAVEVAELRRGRPLPGALEDVAVGEDEPARHLLERVDRRLGVVGRPQAVRPVHAGGHARVDRLDGREQVARVHVLRAEDLAPGQVVVDEVLGEGPVGAVAAHRRLPHVPVGVDHARQHDAAGGIDLRGAVGHLEARSHRGDPLAADQHVGVGEDRVRVVHRQHGRVPEHDRLARLRSRCCHEEFLR